jgi:hypothetical protein
MNKLNFYRSNATFFVILIILVLVVSAVIVAVVFISSQGINTSNNQTIIGIVVGIAGALIGALVSVAIYFQVQRETRKQRQLLESVDSNKNQLGDYFHLSEQGLELEKQRTGIEKQTSIVLWIMAVTEKVEDDPRLAFVIMYQRLEEEILGLISRLYPVDTPKDTAKLTFSLSYDFDFLAEYVMPDEANFILQMRDIRNRVVHGEISPEEVTPEKVRSYLQEASRLAQVLSRIKRNDGT